MESDDDAPPELVDISTTIGQDVQKKAEAEGQKVPITIVTGKYPDASAQGLPYDRILGGRKDDVAELRAEGAAWQENRRDIEW
jgi:hypothetical protein